MAIPMRQMIMVFRIRKMVVYCQILRMKSMEIAIKRMKRDALLVGMEIQSTFQKMSAIQLLKQRPAEKIDKMEMMEDI